MIYQTKQESVIFNVSVADFLAAANSYRLENQPVFGAACITCIKNKKELKIYTSVIYSR